MSYFREGLKLVDPYTSFIVGIMYKLQCMQMRPCTFSMYQCTLRETVPPFLSVPSHMWIAAL